MKCYFSFLFVTIQIKHTYGELITMFIFFIQSKPVNCESEEMKQAKKQRKRSVKSFAAISSMTLYQFLLLGSMSD